MSGQDPRRVKLTDVRKVERYPIPSSPVLFNLLDLFKLGSVDIEENLRACFSKCEDVRQEIRIFLLCRVERVVRCGSEQVRRNDGRLLQEE